jgi:hypothetical protein
MMMLMSKPATAKRGREALEASIKQARRELARGEVRRGTVEDLMAEIEE